MTRDDVPDYFKVEDVPDYLKVDPYKYEPTKPLYILIKVEVDKDIVYNQEKADTYAINHCNKMEYELVDHYYPDNEQYPYIAK